MERIVLLTVLLAPAPPTALHVSEENMVPLVRTIVVNIVTVSAAMTRRSVRKVMELVYMAVLSDTGERVAL